MLNKTILIGRLTKDPVLTHTKSENPSAVAKFTLAVNRDYFNAQGERDTDFINVVVWKKTAESVAKFMKKGSLVAVEGRIQTRSYDDPDGKKVYVVEVIGESVKFLESKGNGSQNANSTNSNNNSNNEQTNKGTSTNNNSEATDDPFSPNFTSQGNTEDDLPF